jgi:hypothetical protein
MYSVADGGGVLVELGELPCNPLEDGRVRDDLLEVHAPHLPPHHPRLVGLRFGELGVARAEGCRRHLDVVGQRRAQVEEVELAPDRAALRLGSRAVRADAREVRGGARPLFGEGEGAAVQPPAAGHFAGEPLGVCICLCKYAAIGVGVQSDIW